MANAGYSKTSGNDMEAGCKGPIQTLSVSPIRCKCFNCNEEGTTEVETLCGSGSWIPFLLLCVCTIGSCGLFAAFFFCFDCQKDAIHRCRNCQYVVAERKINF
jgi:hypothetical protein